MAVDTPRLEDSPDLIFQDLQAQLGLTERDVFEEALEHAIFEALDEFAGGMMSEGRTAQKLSTGQQQEKGLAEDGMSHEAPEQDGPSAELTEAQIDLELSDEEILSLELQLEALNIQELELDGQYLDEFGRNLKPIDIYRLKQGFSTDKKQYALMLLALTSILNKMMLLKKGIPADQLKMTPAEQKLVQVLKQAFRHPQPEMVIQNLRALAPALNTLAKQVIDQNMNLEAKILVHELSKPEIQKKLMTPEAKKFVEALLKQLKLANPALAQNLARALRTGDLKLLAATLQQSGKQLQQVILKAFSGKAQQALSFLPTPVRQILRESLQRLHQPVLQRAMTQVISREPAPRSPMQTTARLQAALESRPAEVKKVILETARRLQPFNKTVAATLTRAAESGNAGQVSQLVSSHIQAPKVAQVIELKPNALETRTAAPQEISINTYKTPQSPANVNAPADTRAVPAEERTTPSVEGRPQTEAKTSTEQPAAPRESVSAPVEAAPAEKKAEPLVTQPAKEERAAAETPRAPATYENQKEMESFLETRLAAAEKGENINATDRKNNFVEFGKDGSMRILTVTDITKNMDTDFSFMNELFSGGMGTTASPANEQNGTKKAEEEKKAKPENISAQDPAASEKPKRDGDIANCSFLQQEDARRRAALEAELAQQALREQKNPRQRT